MRAAAKNAMIVVFTFQSSLAGTKKPTPQVEVRPV
jgi:hypothetical protein